MPRIDIYNWDIDLTLSELVVGNLALVVYILQGLGSEIRFKID